MEIIFGVLSAGCLSYLITEVNEIQRELKELRKDVTWVQTKLDRREKSSN
jgi:hypothetical protein